MLAPQGILWSPHYLHHNQRRKKHLASWLERAAQTVLEAGGGLEHCTNSHLLVESIPIRQGRH